jgi:hypothetical protein
MKNKLYFVFVLVLIFSFCLTGCVSTPQPTEAPVQVVPTDEPTVAPPPTAVPPTEVPPTAVPPTAEPTVAPTEAPAEVATEATAAEVTAAIASDTGVTVTAGQDTNCRKYPMRNSNVLGYLKANTAVAVHGKNSDGDWYYISNPTNPGQRMCWVWSGTLTVAGDAASLVVIPNSVND